MAWRCSASHSRPKSCAAARWCSPSGRRWTPEATFSRRRRDAKMNRRFAASGTGSRRRPRPLLDAASHTLKAPKMKNMDLALARLLHGVVALAALAGIGLELAAAITGGAGAAPTHLERFVRLFSYFTIDANILIGGTSALLAFRPAHDSRLFRPLRLTAVLSIAVTGIVFHTVLTGLRE